MAKPRFTWGNLVPSPQPLLDQIQKHYKKRQVHNIEWTQCPGCGDLSPSPLQANQIVDLWPTSIKPSHNELWTNTSDFPNMLALKGPPGLPGPGVENGEQAPGYQANSTLLDVDRILQCFSAPPSSPCLILGLLIHLNNQSALALFHILLRDHTNSLCQFEYFCNTLLPFRML